MAVVKTLELLDDYSPADSTGTFLRVLLDDQGDVYLTIIGGERGWSDTMRIAASGTRYTPEFRQALRRFLIDVEAEAQRSRRGSVRIPDLG